MRIRIRQSSMTFISIFTTTLCTLLLCACSPNSEQTPAPKLFKEQRGVLDKAKGVDELQQKQFEEQQKALEKQAQ